jgi:uncharacterized membrane protein YjfL (UPF0719 family)
LADAIVTMVLILVQFVVGLAFSMAGVYISIKLFDLLTPNIEEWKEMKKGNVAVGLLLGAIVFSVSLGLEGGVSAIISLISSDTSPNAMVVGLLVGMLNLLISLIATVFSIYVAVKILDWMTTDIDEFAELKKGNLAVAIMMAAVLVAVSILIRGAVAGVTKIINAVALMKMAGL